MKKFLDVSEREFGMLLFYTVIAFLVIITAIAAIKSPPIPTRAEKIEQCKMISDSVTKDKCLVHVIAGAI